MGSNKKLQTGAWGKYINKYTISLACFLIWICFFDRHNLINQYRLQNVITGLESQKNEYQELYKTAKEEKKLLDSDQERYAREKYFMHKDNEEVYIIKKNDE